MEGAKKQEINLDKPQQIINITINIIFFIVITVRRTLTRPH